MLRKIIFINIALFVIAFNIKAEKTLSLENTMKDTTEFKLEKFNKGVDFYANGNEPFWGAELAFNQYLRFHVLEGISIDLGSVKGEKAMDANIIRYAQNTDHGFFSMTISQQECMDDMSGEIFDYKVIVELNNPGDADYQKFEGCGNYVPNYKLNRTWILKTLEGKDAVDSDYSNGLPNLEFDVEQKSFGGTGGCNRIRGSVFIEGSTLRFGQVASTMMMCPEIDLESQFTKALEKVTTYKLIGNQLLLSNPDEMLMVLYDPTLEVLERGSDELPDYYPLHDIWVLETINDVSADEANYMKGLPRLEIDINEMKFAGSGGCNQIFGTFEADKENIKFGSIGATRMACPGNYESDFLTALGNAKTYKVENNRLYLIQDGKTLVVLKKID